MSWDSFKRIRFRKKKEMPGGLWLRCPDCGAMVYRDAVQDLLQVCPECNYHFAVSIEERIAYLLDDDTWEEVETELTSDDPLGFVAVKAYKDRLARAKKATGQQSACRIGRAKIAGRDVIFGGTDARFLMGSMGSVVGEKFTRAVELATKERKPFIFVSGSGGGARMDEGVLSLMQMAKTSAALARMDDAGGLFISILTHPTMGGCMASFAALGDITIAEPKALLGFAGPTVIKNTIRADLPEGFQRSEFLLEKGFLDLIVNRVDQRETLARLLEHCQIQAAS
ncbi:MAG TPA: acetyl-CoA carboxylase carboxyl transferase subunit beta [Planctomycetes bacterium]|nr:acetyl-CoA carboxylase carboxyl transferase subunit beta [Planctomycetota bacterium]|tara:strand:+ start:231 stop:1079 length:849 start_codon:yes stop_codon:yes gene_type:complete